MLKNIKEKLERIANNNTFVRKVNKFLESKWYIIAFAIFVFIVQTFGLEPFGYLVMALLFTYTCLFMPNTNATIPIICFATFATSTVHSPAKKASGYEILGAGKFGLGEASQFLSSPAFIVPVIIGIVILAIGIIYRMLAYAQYKKAFNKKSLVWGIIALSVAYLVSGLGYSNYSIDDFIMAGVQAVCLFAVYFFIVTTADFAKFNLDKLAEFCVVILFYIVALVIYIYATRFYGFLRFTGSWKAYMLCGWGMSNDFGILIVMTLPAFFYKMYTAQKHAYIWYIFACLAMVVTFFTYARGAILVGAGVFALGSVYAIIRKNSRKTALISISSALVALVGVVVILHLTGGLEFIMEYHLGKVANGAEIDKIDSGRTDIWKRYFDYFVENPIFGGGFTVDKIFYIANGAEVENGAFSAYSYFAHNTLFQILGSCGLVGLMAYLYHTLTTVLVFFIKPNEKRFIFAVSIFAFVAMAMLDVVFFKPYFIFLYAIILAVCEADAKKSANEKNLISEQSIETKENDNV
jgi:O-antigen ligase